MGTFETHKKRNNPNQKQGLKHALEGMLERLRNGLEDVVEGLRLKEPKLAPIPVPSRGSRRR